MNKKLILKSPVTPGLFFDTSFFKSNILNNFTVITYCIHNVIIR